MAATHPPGLPLTGGRRAALVIGVPVCLLLLLFTAFSLVAMFGQGSYPVRYTVSGAARSVSLAVPGGQLAVTGTTGGPATVTGTARYSLVRSTVSAHTAGGTARFGYACAVSVGECELDLTAAVPPGVGVTASTSGGDAAVTSTAGPVTVSTGGGNLTATGVSGPLSLTTSGGDITGRALAAGTVSATSGGGNIQLTFARVPREVHVSTSGGDITLVLPGSARYRVTAHSDSGAAAVSNTIPQDSSSLHVIDASTGGGHITIRQQ
jgi:hypothetical protein